MSEIYIPYILHENINYKYGVLAKIEDSSGERNTKCTIPTGLHPHLNLEETISYADFADKLLLYDKCIINIADYMYLIEKIGYALAKELLKQGAIQLFNNLDFRLGFGQFHPNVLIRLFSAGNNGIDEFEIKINDNIKSQNLNISSAEKKELLYDIINAKKIDNIKNVIDKLNEEATADITNPNIVNKLGLVGNLSDQNGEYNYYILNRILHLNYYLQIASILGIQNILMPEEVSNILSLKLGTYLNYKTSQEYGDFLSLCQLENIPKVSDIILKGAINYKDIIEMRNHRDCIKFREWLSTQSSKGIILKDEQRDIRQLYINACLSKRNFENAYNSELAKTIRWVIPNIAGVVPGPIGQGLSVGLSGLDIIVEKVIKGYRPSMFLHDYLRHEIDSKMEIAKKKQELENIKKIYGQLGRNDMCPCGLGKKYKKCHGRYEV